MLVLSGDVAVTKELITGLNYEQFVKDRNLPPPVANF